MTILQFAGAVIQGTHPSELRSSAPAALSEVELLKSVLAEGYCRFMTGRELISHPKHFLKTTFTSVAKTACAVFGSRLTLCVLVVASLIIAAPIDAGANPINGLRFMGLTRIQAEAKIHVNTFHCEKFFCWGPNLTNHSDGLGPEFFTVIMDTGFVDGYSQRLRSGSDYNQALDQLKIGLPVDVKFRANRLESSNGNRCEFVDATSRDLALVMGKHDPKGVIGIELSSGVNSNLQVLYSGANIEDASVSLVSIARGTGC